MIKLEEANIRTIDGKLDYLQEKEIHEIKMKFETQIDEILDFKHDVDGVDILLQLYPISVQMNLKTYKIVLFFILILFVKLLQLLLAYILKTKAADFNLMTVLDGYSDGMFKEEY